MLSPTGIIEIREQSLVFLSAFVNERQTFNPGRWNQKRNSFNNVVVSCLFSFSVKRTVPAFIQRPQCVWIYILLKEKKNCFLLWYSAIFCTFVWVVLNSLYKYRQPDICSLQIRNCALACSGQREPGARFYREQFCPKIPVLNSEGEKWDCLNGICL